METRALSSPRHATAGRAPAVALGLAFAGVLALLYLGLGAEKPVLYPLLALAAPVAAAMLYLDAFTLLCVGLALLPWAVFINVTDTLPIITFYFFSLLAAFKLMLTGGPKILSANLMAMLAYGLFLTGSAVLMGNFDETKSKLFHWFNFAVFYFTAYNTCDSLPKARRMLQVLIAAMLGNALFSIALYYVANFLFPTPGAFVESVLFKVGKVTYGARGFDLIQNGTNWFTVAGNLKALGLFHNPTQASIFAVTSFGLTSFLLLDRRRWVPRGLLWANLGASLAHLILCSGRSGMAVAPILISVWLYAWVKISGLRISFRNLAVSAALMALVGVTLGNVLVMNFNSLVSLNYYSNAGRLVAMTSGLTVASYAGPFGFGFGNTPPVMEMGLPSTFLQIAVSHVIGAVSYSFKSVLANEYYRQTNYHSLYLHMIAETGYIGFLLFIGVFYKLGAAPKGDFLPLKYGCFAVVAAFFVSQAVGGDIFYPKVMIALLAVVMLAERLNSDPDGKVFRPEPEASV